MSLDFLDDLLKALRRALSTDEAALREILIISGMPDKTANIQYLGFNRQSFQQDDRNLEFSAVAVINNRRAAQWQLRGYRKTISQMVFHPLWTRNPLDLFLNRLRCDERVMQALAGAQGDYTLMGILTTTESETGAAPEAVHRRVRPVLAVPGLDSQGLSIVTAFESENEIRKA